MEKVYGVPEGMTGEKTSFCAGCTHMLAQKLIVECLNEMGERDNAILSLAIGCSMNSVGVTDIHTIQASHGRSAAVATGISRMNPDKIVLTYQGDGDTMSIGIAESLHTANRGEKVTVITINNQIYGMTGGQMSATTLVGQNSTTGVRKPELMGYPFNFAEMIGNLKAPGYVARGALYSPKYLMQAKEMIRKALRCQKEKGLYSYVELLSFCPTNWGVAPKDCLAYCEENVLPVFPVGEFKTCF